MVNQPDTRYARGPQGNLAFQVVGDGPIDLVVVPGWFSHVDLQWGDPGWAKFVTELASFARVILYDKLGTGLSDPVDGVPTLEGRVDDLRAVLDAAGSDRPAVFGFSQGGPIAILFAAAHPGQVSALVLYGTYANGSAEDDGSPVRRLWKERMATIRESIEHWGEGRTVDWAVPSLSDNALYRRAVGALERAGMSPRMALLTWQTHISELNVSGILDSVRVPTLVLHRNGDALPAQFGRDLAAGIPGARYVELEGIDHWPGAGDVESITGEVEEFLTGQRHEREPDRALATVLFTDIVDSTKHAVALGDRSWHDLLERHDEITREEVRRFRGRVVKHTGDGFLATFDGPTRAVRCATTIAERMPDIGIQIRSGLHAGECDLRGDDIGGIAVHIGARIGALATAGEVLVSSTVKDLVNGSGIDFRDRGTRALKGVPGEWRIFSIAGQGDSGDHVLADPDPAQDRMADIVARRPAIGRLLLRASRRAKR